MSTHAAAFADVRQLLGSTTLRDYLSSRPPSTIVVLRTEKSLEKSLKVLASASITSAPLFEQSDGAYLGFFAWPDVARALLAACPPRACADADARALALRAAGARLGRLPLAALPGPPPRPGRGQAAMAAAGDDGALIYRADLGTTLDEVVRRGFLAPAPGRGVRHRVAVFELADEDGGEGEGEEGEDGDDGDQGEGGREEGRAMGERAGDGERGAGAAAAMEEDAGGGDGGGQGQQERQQCQGRRPPPPRAPDEPADADDAAVRAIRITHVLSQSDVVRFLARRPRALGAAGALTLEQLGLARKGGRGVVCVPAAMPALHALSALMSTQVSSVGVVENGELCASLSPSDLRGLVPERFDALARPVLPFLRQRAWAAGGGGVGAVDAGHGAGAGAGSGASAPGAPADAGWDVRGAESLREPPRPACVAPTATLAEVVRLLAGGEHRAVFVSGPGEEGAGSGAMGGAAGGGGSGGGSPLPQGVVTATDVLRVVTGFDDASSAEEGEEDGGEDAAMGEDEGDEKEDEAAVAGAGGEAVLLASGLSPAAGGRGADRGSAGVLNGGVAATGGAGS